jgi:hypothetical protein
MEYVTIPSLWLPILLSSVIVFVASFIIWAVVQLHKKDWGKLPNEDAFRSAFKGASVPEGQYMVPHCADQKDMATDEMKAKIKEGPVVFLVVRPNALPNMGQMLSCWFVYCLAVGASVAYLTGRCVAPGTAYLAVFRITGTVAFLAYSMALFPQAIWFGRTWSSIWKEVFDGFVYALLTAGTFAWLWPEA